MFDTLLNLSDNEIRKLRKVFGRGWKDALATARQIGGITADQLAKLGEVFGSDWQKPIREVLSASKHLEDLGVAFKSDDPNVGRWLEEAIKRLERAGEDEPLKLLRSVLGSLRAESGETAHYKEPHSEECDEYEYPKPKRRKAAGGNPLEDWAAGTPLAAEQVRGKALEVPDPKSNPISSWALASGAGHLAATPRAAGQKVLRYQLQPDGRATRVDLGTSTTDPIGEWLGVGQSFPHQRRPLTDPDAAAQKALAEEARGVKSATFASCAECGRRWPLNATRQCVCGGTVAPGTWTEARRATGRPRY